MLRQSDKDTRDRFFKEAQGTIQKMADSDLSLPQNVDNAYKVFQPLIEDKQITNDMAKTHKLMNAYQDGDSLRNCVPSKTNPCQGQYWEGGKQLLNYWQQDFANSSDDEALGFEDPRFVPAVNVSKDAMDYLVKSKLTMGSSGSVDEGSGRVYNTFTKNGHQMILPAHHLLMGIFGDDPKVQDYFNAQAQLTRRNFIEQHLPQFGGDRNAAEDAFFHQYSPFIQDHHAATGKQLTKAQQSIQKTQDAMGATIDQHGPITPQSDIYKFYADTIGESAILGSAKNIHQQAVDNMDQSTLLSADRRSQRARVDAAMGNMLLSQHLYGVAKDYATMTQETKKTADPYALDTRKLQDKLIEIKAQGDEKLRYAQAIGKIKILSGEDNSLKPLPLEGGSAGPIDLWNEQQGISGEQTTSYQQHADQMNKQFINSLINIKNQPQGDSYHKQMAAKAADILKNQLGITTDNPDYTTNRAKYFGVISTQINTPEFRALFPKVSSDMIQPAAQVAKDQMANEANTNLVKTNNRNVLGYLSKNNPADFAKVSTLFNPDGTVKSEDQIKKIDPNGDISKLWQNHFNSSYKVGNIPIVKPLVNSGGGNGLESSQNIGGYTNPDSNDEATRIALAAANHLGTGDYLGIVPGFDPKGTEAGRMIKPGQNVGSGPDLALAAKLYGETLTNESRLKPSKSKISGMALVSPKEVVLNDPTKVGISMKFPERFLDEMFKGKDHKLPGTKSDYEQGFTQVYDRKNAPPEIFDRFKTKPVSQTLIDKGSVHIYYPGAVDINLKKNQDGTVDATGYFYQVGKDGHLNPEDASQTGISPATDFDKMYDYAMSKAAELARFNTQLANSKNNPTKKDAPIKNSQDARQYINQVQQATPLYTFNGGQEEEESPEEDNSETAEE